MTIEASNEEVERALLQIARHVSVGIEIGRPLAVFKQDATGDLAIFTDLEAPQTMWFPEDHRVCRLVELRGGGTELTEYADGEEVSRKTRIAE